MFISLSNSLSHLINSLKLVKLNIAKHASPRSRSQMFEFFILFIVKLKKKINQNLSMEACHVCVILLMLMTWT